MQRISTLIEGAVMPMDGTRTPAGLRALINLLPTASIEASLETATGNTAERLGAMLEDAHERDRLTAERQALGQAYADCWCLGLGGAGEHIAAINGGSYGMIASVPTADGPSRPVTAFRAYCRCPDGKEAEKRTQEAVEGLLGAFKGALARRRADEARLPVQYDGLNLDTWESRAATSGADRTDIQSVEDGLGSWSFCVLEGNGPKNLLLAGGYGNGKSGLATHLAREMLDAGRSVIYRRVAEVLAELRAAPYRARQEGRDEDVPITELEILRRCSEVDLLVLDDLGAEAMVGTGADRAVEALMFMVDGRLDTGRPTVVVTNLSSKLLIERVGQRLVDRLTSPATSHVVVVRTPSLRTAVWS